MRALFHLFRHDTGGATAVEYGIIAALIAVSIITGAELMGDGIADVFTGAANTLKNAQ